MSISRAEILARVEAVPLGVIPYSQATISPVTGYRADCSGWVSYCWHCPTSGPGTWGGYSTETFVTLGVMVEIPRAELRPGDAIGKCGPGTAGGGGGHICLWLGNEPGGKHHVRDHGSGLGPKDQVISWRSGYKAWRFTGVVEDDGTTYPHTIDTHGGVMLCKKGDGGDVVTVLQLQILAAGGQLPKFGADGGYGGETAAALVALGVCGGDKTGATYGPWEYVELAKLVAKNAAPPAAPAPAPGGMPPHNHSLADIVLSGTTGPAHYGA